MRVLKSKLLLVLCASFLIACANRGTSETTAPVQKKFSASDVAKLRWIEGTWRGSGVDQAPFFERYRFEGESTIAVDSFPDEKLEKIDDTTLFQLKDGEFGGGSGGARWIASDIDDRGITFEPVAKAKNSFRWERESPNAWKAILTWPASEDKPARERIYKMERIPGK
jgi:hypothetical protein